MSNVINIPIVPRPQQQAITQQEWEDAKKRMVVHLRNQVMLLSREIAAIDPDELEITISAVKALVAICREDQA
jgi:hypothetical protein